jgi:hypothetical protein
MVFNATFNNISVIFWQSVLLVEESGVPGENHRPVASHWQTLSHNVFIKFTSLWTGFELTTLVVIGTECTGSCKSNYHTIITTTAPEYDEERGLRKNRSLAHNTNSRTWIISSKINSTKVWEKCKMTYFSPYFSPYFLNVYSLCIQSFQIYYTLIPKLLFIILYFSSICV